MGKETGISWTDHTFNPWVGCQKVSPGCDHCYAEVLDTRFGNASNWGPGAQRRHTSKALWAQPRRWNEMAKGKGIRAKVFCASMADVFDNAVPVEWRLHLWELIRETPWLDWQMLTKRPQNFDAMLPGDWGMGYPNVWLGVSMENQTEKARRLPILYNTPARIRFASYEPALGHVDICEDVGMWWNQTMDTWEGSGSAINRDKWGGKKIDWIIYGGESGPGHRPDRVEWAESMMEQCHGAGIALYYKQDSGPKSGQRGRASDELWAMKEFPA